MNLVAELLRMYASSKEERGDQKCDGRRVFWRRTEEMMMMSGWIRR